MFPLNYVVSLTKTESKGKELKKELVDKVRDALEELVNYTIDRTM